VDYKDICVQRGVKTLRDANLHDADLRGASLRGANLRGASLRDADLSGASLYGACLRDANLYGACLRDADLSGAGLSGANLRDAYLRDADLRGANLRNANLYGAYLRDANLRGANLYGADLRNANLYGADLYGADLPHFLIVPEKGGFTAFKKVNGAVLELYVPASAKRTSSLIGRKIRVSHAKVVKAYPRTKPLSEYKALFKGDFVYVVGETVEADKFDDDIRVECTHGIHCFITRKEAKEH